MKRNRKIPTSLLIVLLCLAGMWGYARYWFWDQTDLGHQPPSKVYKKVFSADLPPGITQFQAAGISSLSGEVWMKFRVNDVDKALQLIWNNKKRAFSVTDRECPFLPSREDVRRSKYAKSVNWNTSFSAHAPEYFEFTFPENKSTGWVGTIILDRKQKTFYVHGGLL
jgi:hypothetical protein